MRGRSQIRCVMNNPDTEELDQVFDFTRWILETTDQLQAQKYEDKEEEYYNAMQDLVRDARMC